MTPQDNHYNINDEQALLLAAEHGDGDAAAVLGSIRNAQHRPDEAERWFRQAAQAGHEPAALLLSTLLTAKGDLVGAQQLLEDVVDRIPLSPELLDELADVLTTQGKHDQAEPYRDLADSLRNDAQREPPDGTTAGAPPWVAPEYVAAAAAAVMAAGVVPFIKTIATKAAEDSYNSVRGWLRRLRDANHGRSKLLVIEESSRDLNLALHLSTDTPDEAIRALETLDVDELVSRARKHRAFGQDRNVQRVRIYWNQARCEWVATEDG